MRTRTLLGILGAIYFLAAASAASAAGGIMAYYWSKGLGDVGNDVAHSVAVDGAGNVIVVGSFEGSVDFGGGDLSSVGGEDIFIVKYNQYGTHLWSMRFGDIGGDQGVDVAVDAAGSIYMTGYFEDTVEFGGGALLSAGGRDIFIVKFSSTGTHMWSMSYGSAFGNDEGRSVAVDGSGNVILAGEFGLTMNIGGFNLVSNGNSDLFIARFNTFGTLDWPLSFGGTGYDTMGEVAASKQNDDIYITGNFPNSIDFGGGALVSAGDEDIFLARFSPGGGHQWSQRFGGADADYGSGLVVDSADHVTMTGAFFGAVNFGGGTHFPGGATNAFIASYNNGGTYQWSRGIAQSHGWDITTNADDDVMVTGLLLGTGDFGGGNLTSAGSIDMVVAWYDNLGNHKWSKNYGDTGLDAGFGIAIDYNGHPAAVGESDGSIYFGGDTHVSAGGYDMFIARWFGEIEIGSLDDADSDRGRSALMVWVKHFLDGPPIPIDPPQAPITHYSIWRAVDMLPGYPPDPICPAASAGQSRATTVTTCDLWERVADIAATGNEEYQLLVPTTRDATPGDPAVHYFVIVAEDDQGGYHTSAPESVSTTNELGSVIVAITDVPNDNGRRVSVIFTRDSEDAPGASTPVWSYEVYRRDDPPPATAVPAAASGKGGDGPLRIDGWTHVATAPAHGDSSYSVEAPTIGDSTIASGAYNSTFFVRATTATPTEFFDSQAAAGYSLDNLAPAMPTGLAYNAGILSWDPSEAADFDYFTVYGSLYDDIGNAVVVDYTTGESMDVSSSGYYWFYVTATDFSGNEGPPATFWIATGVGDTPRRYVLSVSNYPNPFNPSTTVKYTVPSPGDVTVAVYNARGARVATLVDNVPHPAGAFSTGWDGRSDDGSALASGVYFARVSHPAGNRSKKVVLLK